MTATLCEQKSEAAKPDPSSILPQAVAKLADSLLWKDPSIFDSLTLTEPFQERELDRLRHSGDQPTIGLILCQERRRLLAEYSFAGIDKPIGISTYELSRSLPKGLQSALPTVEEIETELGEFTEPERPKQTGGRKKKGGGK